MGRQLPPAWCCAIHIPLSGDLPTLGRDAREHGRAAQPLLSPVFPTDPARKETAQSSPGRRVLCALPWEREKALEPRRGTGCPRGRGCRLLATGSSGSAGPQSLGQHESQECSRGKLLISSLHTGQAEPGTARKSWAGAVLTDPGHQPPSHSSGPGTCPGFAAEAAPSPWDTEGLSQLCCNQQIPMAAGSLWVTQECELLPSRPWALSHGMCAFKLFLTCWPEHGVSALKVQFAGTLGRRVQPGHVPWSPVGRNQPST